MPVFAGVFVRPAVSIRGGGVCGRSSSFAMGTRGVRVLTTGDLLSLDDVALGRGGSSAGSKALGVGGVGSASFWSVILIGRGPVVADGVGKVGRLAEIVLDCLATKAPRPAGYAGGGGAADDGSRANGWASGIAGRSTGGAWGGGCSGAGAVEVRITVDLVKRPATSTLGSGVVLAPAIEP